MALTNEDLQAIGTLMDDKLDKALAPIKEQQEAHTASIEKMLEQQEAHNKSILRLENNVMHELKMLNENLPDALARRVQFEEMSATVDEHGDRIFALEQKASNG